MNTPDRIGPAACPRGPARAQQPVARRAFATLAACLAAFACLAAGPPPAAVWKAGVAKAKITPEESMWLAGYGSRKCPSEGTLHDLWLKALALEAADGGRAVVVCADLLGLPRAMADRVFAALERRHGLERARVMVACSHTHSGPVLKDSLSDIYPLDDAQRAGIDRYADALEGELVAVVGRALADLRPATLALAADTCGFAVNRRENKEPDVLRRRAAGEPLPGPSDHAVPVLAVREPDGALRAVVFGYACHATTLNGQAWCGDYPGFAQIALEAAHPGALALFAAGCGADQNPLPRRTVELCRAYGEQLAGAVGRALAGTARPLPPSLRAAHEFIDLEFGGIPTREELEAAIARGGYQERWGRRLLADLERGVAFPRSYSYPVQVWRLGGDLLWIALGGEVVVDYALRFKAGYGPRTWVTAYANDLMAYIPSRRVRDEGGYEAGAFAVYGLAATVWAEDIEERIAAAVGRMAR